MTVTTPAAPPTPPGKPGSTLVLLVRHGETPATGMVLPGRAPGPGTHPDVFERIVIRAGSVSVISYGEGQAPSVLMVDSTLAPLSGLRVP